MIENGAAILTPIQFDTFPLNDESTASDLPETQSIWFCRDMPEENEKEY